MAAGLLGNREARYTAGVGRPLRKDVRVSSGVLEVGLSEPVVAGAEVRPAAEASERVMVSKLRRRDPEAFEALVLAHQDRVYNFCVRMLNDREEAHDLVQEIFVSIHQNLGKFRMDARLSTWILRIARNHCLNRLKYLKRRGRGRSEAFGEANEGALRDAMDGPQKPDDALTSAHERDLVRRAIARLDEEQRVLVVLRDIEQMTYEEIIEITELAEGTVKSRLHRAREKLATIIAELED